MVQASKKLSEKQLKCEEMKEDHIQDTTRYKSIYWQPRRLDCHIPVHNTQNNTLKLSKDTVPNHRVFTYNYALRYTYCQLHKPHGTIEFL